MFLVGLIFPILPELIKEYVFQNYITATIAVSCLIIVITSQLFDFYQYFIKAKAKKCPTCKNGNLKGINFIRATSVSEEGKRHPNSWSYYECEACKERFKVFINGDTITPTSSEWEMHCK